MFEREHHLRIATILQALNADVLLSHGCLFGGGTAIVLSHDEYRESVDIDFLISNKSGFRDLRQDLKFANNLSPIVRKDTKLILARDIRMDQYGIRTMLDVGGTEIKFEIVFEARIALELPGPNDRICGVATLSRTDMAASKLLANSDRWSDNSVFSRDLIDLAMLDLSPSLLKSAIDKASNVYGESVKKDLRSAIEYLKKKPGRLSDCLSSLKMGAIPEAVVWSKIREIWKQT